jgi:multiple sugar transport system substrate-binding protein
MLAPSWRVFDVKQINPDTNFRIVPIPQLPGSTVNWASYWVEGVSSKSMNKDAAWKLVSYLTNRDGMIKVYSSAANTRLFGEPYSRKDLSGNLAGDPYVEAYVQQAETAQSFPLASRTFDNGLNDQMIKYLEDAVNGLSAGGSPTSVLTTAANGFQQVLSRYGLVSAAAPQGQ